MHYYDIIFFMAHKKSCWSRFILCTFILISIEIYLNQAMNQVISSQNLIVVQKSRLERLENFCFQRMYLQQNNNEYIYIFIRDSLTVNATVVGLMWTSGGLFLLVRSGKKTNRGVGPRYIIHILKVIRKWS